MIKMQVIKKSDKLDEMQKAIRQQAREVVIRNALGAAQQAYDIYPVGPDHKDGSPHTRDTFTIAVDDQVIAENGNFWGSGAEGFTTDSPQFKVALKTAGASFFLEFGTIYIEPMPILRIVVKQAQAAIINELRQINLRNA